MLTGLKSLEYDDRLKKRLEFGHWKKDAEGSFTVLHCLSTDSKHSLIAILRYILFCGNMFGVLSYSLKPASFRSLARHKHSHNHSYGQRAYS